MENLQQTFTCCLLLTTFVYIVATPVCNFVDSRKKNLVCDSSNTSDFVLKRGFISDNENTETIALRGCEITDLDHDSLQNLSSLKYLDLSENKLEQLKVGIFDGTPFLIYLNISKNLLNELPMDLFAHTPFLVVLDLKENRLDTIHVGIFDRLKELKSLDLSWNNFLGLDLNPLLFEQNKLIKYLSFSGNDMNYTPENLLHSLESLETLNLHGCAIDEVPAFATKTSLGTLNELILSSNQLSVLDNETVFIHLENLEILNLSENELEFINEYVFIPLVNLKVINLQNNKLSHLPGNLFQKMPYLENINLSHNMITKISINIFLRKPVKILNLAFNRVTYLSKHFCLELKKSGANLTEFYFHQNPWQCACLKEILDEAKDSHLVHRTDLPGYNKPVCVTSYDYRCKRDDTFNNMFVDIYDKIKLLGKRRAWSSVSKPLTLE